MTDTGVYSLTVTVVDRKIISLWSGVDNEIIAWPLKSEPEVDDLLLLTESIDEALEVCGLWRVIPFGPITREHMSDDFATVVIGVSAANQELTYADGYAAGREDAFTAVQVYLTCEGFRPGMTSWTLGLRKAVTGS